MHGLTTIGDGAGGSGGHRRRSAMAALCMCWAASLGSGSAFLHCVPLSAQFSCVPSHALPPPRVRAAGVRTHGLRGPSERCPVLCPRPSACAPSCARRARGSATPGSRCVLGMSEEEWSGDGDASAELSQGSSDRSGTLPVIPNFDFTKVDFDSPAGKPLVVGLAGGTGSGKSTMKDIILRELVSCFPAEQNPDALVATLSHDNYYKHRPDLSDGERDQINFDHPDSLETELMVHDLKQLLAGKPVECPVYDFATHLRRQDTVLHVEPRPIILVEGILIFTNEDLRNLMNLRVYVDVEADRRILRRIERDLVDRGRSFQSIVSQYLTTVKPMHDTYVEPSKMHADLIVPHGAHNSVAVQVRVDRCTAAIVWLVATVGSRKLLTCAVSCSRPSPASSPSSRGSPATHTQQVLVERLRAHLRTSLGSYPDADCFLD